MSPTSLYYSSTIKFIILQENIKNLVYLCLFVCVFVIFGPKNFEFKKFCVQKILGTFFWVKTNFGPKTLASENFRFKKILVEKYFGSKKFWVRKKYWFKNNFWSREGFKKRGQIWAFGWTSSEVPHTPKTWALLSGDFFIVLFKSTPLKTGNIFIG